MFVVTALADGVIGHALPVSGDQQSVTGGVVVGLVLNLLVVLLLSRPFGVLVRRVRSDMPVGVARNYAGTFAILLVCLGFVGVGLANRSNIEDNHRALRDALVRAQAYIGARAPDPFRRNVGHPDTFTIEAGSVYRTCVPNDAHTRYWCVIVRRDLPFARSVSFDGYESNQVFSTGAD